MKIRKSKGEKALKQVAEQNSVSIEEVRAEIEKAIEIGMANPDPEIQKQWKPLCKNDKKPTPEELIMRLSNSIKNK